MAIDKTARRILTVLDEHGELPGPRIADRLDVASGSVSHSMREHLLPRGLVETVRTETNPGSARDTHHYQLTEQGQGWLDEHGDKVTIDSLDDLQDGVEQAVEVAESARESVQSYRQKLARANDRSKENKDRIDEIDGDYASMVELLRIQKNAREHADEHADDLDARIDYTQESTKKTLQRLARELDAQRNRVIDRIEELEETVANQQERIDEQAEQIEGLESRRWF
ncbi:hypothetical protein ACFPYI_14740 [Halomarina salina]|uniref:MarR family transcriptional regulator n=1 Tax=Halomarina salina TaxID=1872699 RepID=A0ABD5RQB4_9EURY|nr:hypothetical protein [Halomarina salina]